MKKTAALAVRILRSNFGPLKSPYKAILALNYRCNHRCLSCNIWKKKPQKEFSADDAEKLFKANPRLSWVDFTGGEVSLAPDFAETARAAVAHCPTLYMLHFPTNGYLTDQIAAQTERIAALRPKKLIVTVSLDGPPEENARLRGVADAWERSVETFARLRAMRGVEAYFGFTLSEGNAGLIDATVESARRKLPWVRRSDFHVNLFNRSPHFFANQEMEPPDFQRLGPALRDFAGKKGAAANATQFIERRYLKLCGPFSRTGLAPLPCRSLDASCFINPRGDVYPCITWDRKIGSLPDYGWSLEKLFADEAARAAREAIRGKSCPNCWTPCEAYQTMFGSLARAFLAPVRDG